MTNTKEEFKKINEKLLNEIKTDRSKILDLYQANYGFLQEYIRHSPHTKDDFEDLLQIGWLALVDAVEVYISKENTPFPFIAYYRKCLHHRFFQYGLLMQQPMKLPEKNYAKLREDYIFEEFNEKLFRKSYHLETELFMKTLHEKLVTEIKCTLPEKEAYVVNEVYFKNRSMADVGRELGVTRSMIHKRMQKALSLLHQNANVRKLAQDYINL